MVRALNGIINVMVVLFVMWYVFAILAVNFFGGTTYACTDTCTPPHSLRLRCSA